ncbi:FtsX-like permease family protein, partial [Candidatus Bathyarchaeota archaeon]|nr:FtsX-like permease family protein [Candidatus Bathyarchaeota archaeon]
RGYQAWSASPSGSTLYRLGSYIEGKGLPLIIPWAIVVLNVIVTMLNSLFERRREISILSSVGLNPAQIASIFVAEASITGFIAGGIGYLLGLSLYRIMPLLGASLEVHQKISATWSLASIGIAISAVLVGAFAALRNSIVITPSLTRKWKISNQPNTNEPYEIPIPVKFEKQLLNDFTDYLFQNLKNKENDPVMRTSSIKMVIDGEKRIITFAYKSTVLNTGNFFTKNTLFIEPNGSGEYIVKLFSIADSVWAHETGSMIRQLIMAWSDRPKNNNNKN